MILSWSFLMLGVISHYSNILKDLLSITQTSSPFVTAPLLPTALVLLVLNAHCSVFTAQVQHENFTNWHNLQTSRLSDFLVTNYNCRTLLIH